MTLREKWKLFGNVIDKQTMEYHSFYSESHILIGLKSQIITIEEERVSMKIWKLFAPLQLRDHQNSQK